MIGLIKIKCNICSHSKDMDFIEYKKIKTRLKCVNCGSKEFTMLNASSPGKSPKDTKKEKEKLDKYKKIGLKSKSGNTKKGRVKRSKIGSSIGKDKWGNSIKTYTYNNKQSSQISSSVKKIALGDKVKNRTAIESDGSSRAGWMKDRNSRNS